MLNKDLYEIKQSSMTVNEYYTLLKTLWEELYSINMLPTVSSSTEEVTKLLAAIELHREEAKLF